MTDHPPRDSTNRLSSNPASTPSADVGPILFGVQGVGRLEDRQGGPEPDGRSNVGAGDQFPESRHRLGGQRPDVGLDSLPPEPASQALGPAVLAMAVDGFPTHVNLHSLGFPALADLRFRELSLSFLEKPTKE